MGLRDIAERIATLRGWSGPSTSPNGDLTWSYWVQDPQTDFGAQLGEMLLTEDYLEITDFQRKDLASINARAHGEYDLVQGGLVDTRHEIEPPPYQVRFNANDRVSSSGWPATRLMTHWLAHALLE